MRGIKKAIERPRNTKLGRLRQKLTATSRMLFWPYCSDKYRKWRSVMPLCLDVKKVALQLLGCQTILWIRSAISSFVEHKSVVCWSSKLSFHTTPFSKSTTLPNGAWDNNSAWTSMKDHESLMVSNSPRCNHQMVTFGACAYNAYQALFSPPPPPTQPRA